MSTTDRNPRITFSTPPQWPLPLRALLGLLTGALAVALTDWIVPLHSFPLLLAFPVVLLVCWFLGMLAGVLCALTETALVALFLTQTQFRLSVGSTREEARLAMFLAVSVALGWAMRRLAQQRAQLATQELEQQLRLAHAQKELAEERAHAADVLRERDDLLQIALRTNGMGLWAWDLITGTVQWSDEVYRIAGLEAGGMRATIANWIDLIHPDDAPRVRAAVEQTCTTGAEYRQQYRIRLPDGSERWVESQGRCQRDTQGHLRRAVGVIADVTGRKRSEEALLRAEKLAVAGRLAASVAHEINNPLEAVTNLLYLIANPQPEDHSADPADLAAQALDELMRVSLITQQTLKFHRQAGMPKPTLFSEVVHGTLALFRSRLQSAEIKVDLRTSGETEVPCMPGEMQQVVANLLSNAIDAMPNGGRLEVRIRPGRDWRDRTTPGIRATFMDSGCGIALATRLRIFEPFFTAKTETGTGLGLWVVTQLIQRHRGAVSVWSTQRAGNSGTAVSLFLPSVANIALTDSTNSVELQHH